MTPLPVEFLATPLAHRALHDVKAGRPENSRAAIQAAIDAGYGIEIDVQLSKDHQAMVFHDYDLGRLTSSKGPVAQQTSNELAETSLRHSNEGVPSLAEVMEMVNGQVPLLIEIKDQSKRLSEGADDLEKAVGSLCNAYIGPLAVMSFNPHTIGSLQQYVKDLPVGLVTDAFKMSGWPLVSPRKRAHFRDIADYDRVGASFVSHSVTDLDRPRLLELKARNASILCWTVRNKAEEANARKIVDNITFEGYYPTPHKP
ncbi:MAG: glycerophosphodiester phosphodiesterase family protein [Pseudoruegeria sp.]